MQDVFTRIFPATPKPDFEDMVVRVLEHWQDNRNDALFVVMGSANVVRHNSNESAHPPTSIALEDVPKEHKKFALTLL